MMENDRGGAGEGRLFRMRPVTKGPSLKIRHWKRAGHGESRWGKDF